MAQDELLGFKHKFLKEKEKRVNACIRECIELLQ